MKYQGNPAVVDAWQWTGTTKADAIRFCEEIDVSNFQIYDFIPFINRIRLVITIPKGRYIIGAGDYVVRDMDGNHSICPQKIFDESYCKLGIAKYMINQQHSGEHQKWNN